LPRGGKSDDKNMIRISTRLSDGAVVADLNISDKNELMSTVAEFAAKNYGVDSGKALDSPVGVFVRLGKSVDYDAVDDEPVDLVFALFSPLHDGASHLKALAEVSRMFRDEASRSQLRGAKDSAALFALLAGFEERDAA
jgi:nitrogen PTS system EIIA component